MNNRKEKRREEKTGHVHNCDVNMGRVLYVCVSVCLCASVYLFDVERKEERDRVSV